MNARKSIVIVIALAGLLVDNGTAHAGSIEYLTNLSADYIRTFSRNAATDGVDLAVYNPAGAPWLKDDGLYLGLTTQSLFGEYAIEDNGQTYPADIMVPVVPSLHLAWKKGNLGVVGAFTVPAGGGSLVYEKGVPYLAPLAAFAQVDGSASGDTKQGVPPQNGQFSGSTVFYGGTFGVAYRYSIASLSLGGRVMLAKKEIAGEATYPEHSGEWADVGEVRASLKAEKTAMGFGGIIGLHLRPIEEINIGVRYEMETPLEFEAETTSSGLGKMTDWNEKPLESFADGAKEERPLPAVLAAGVAVGPFVGLTFSTSFHYYFIKNADKVDDKVGDAKTNIGGFVRGYDDDYDNGWDAAVSAEYQITKDLVASAGYIHTVIGGNKNTYSDFEYAPGSDSVGGGARYLLTKDMFLTLAFSRTFYDEVTNDPIATETKDQADVIAPNGETFHKRVYDLSLGAQYKF